MTKFEQYLIDSGFTAFRRSNQGLVICDNPGFYTTQGPINGTQYGTTFYIKDDITITFGLDWVQRGVPPIVNHDLIDNDSMEAYDFIMNNEPEVILQRCLERGAKNKNHVFSKS